MRPGGNEDSRQVEFSRASAALSLNSDHASSNAPVRDRLKFSQSRLSRIHPRQQDHSNASLTMCSRSWAKASLGKPTNCENHSRGGERGGNFRSDPEIPVTDSSAPVSGEESEKSPAVENVKLGRELYRGSGFLISCAMRRATS